MMDVVKAETGSTIAQVLAVGMKTEAGMMAEQKAIKVEIYVGLDGEDEIDLHGFHPQDEELTEVITESVRQAFEKGLPTLRIIHGHGRNRFKYFQPFVNSNTGWLGRTVRGILRQQSDLRQWMFAKFDCSHDGSTTVWLRRPSGNKTGR